MNLPTGFCRICAQKCNALYCDVHRPQSKYKSVKAEADGYKFDSRKEQARYIMLKQQEKMGLITDLKLQVTFKLEVNGKLVAKYVADFTYRKANNPNLLIVEDTKGFRTDYYKLKARLFAAVYGFAITEV